MPETVMDLPHLADLGDMVTPDRTALVVVDVQVDFASGEGLIGRYGSISGGARAPNSIRS